MTPLVFLGITFLTFMYPNGYNVNDNLPTMIAAMFTAIVWDIFFMISLAAS